MELKTKTIDLGPFKVIWVIAGIIFFINGIVDSNWYHLIGGFLMNFEHIDVVHWNDINFK